MLIERRPPTLEELSRSLAARMAATVSPPNNVPPRPRLPKAKTVAGARCEPATFPPSQAPACAAARQQRLCAGNGRADRNDPNLTDGARRCARKLAEYTYRSRPRHPRAQITVTYLMKALGKSRRTVQRYLRQLERAGYICVEVIHARTRMCAGIVRHAAGPAVSEASPRQMAREANESGCVTRVTEQ